ncbi:DUF3809 family protein [Thermus oshimai]|jgi:hypothetical protein|uniref:DUF3809 family protein n=1 Tax=Thermus oshimai TaxID=56957 RepID=UPI0031FB4A16
MGGVRIPFPPKGLPLSLRLEGDRLQGEVQARVPVFGEVRLPFAARLEGPLLKPLPLPPPALEVEGRLGDGVLDLSFRLHLGEKWGDRALAHILEALLLRHLEDALSPEAKTLV